VWVGGWQVKLRDPSLTHVIVVIVRALESLKVSSAFFFFFSFVKCSDSSPSASHERRGFSSERCVYDVTASSCESRCHQYWMRSLQRDAAAVDIVGQSPTSAALLCSLQPVSLHNVITIHSIERVSLCRHAVGPWART